MIKLKKNILMEDKESIKKIYIDKIKKLKKHNELYYSKNNPLYYR